MHAKLLWCTKLVLGLDHVRPVKSDNAVNHKKETGDRRLGELIA